MPRKKKPEPTAEDRELGGGLVTAALVHNPTNVVDYRKKPPMPPGYTGPRNDDRADWAAAALIWFAQVTGMLGQEDVETTLSDALADLMHLADREAVDFYRCLARGQDHYREERAEEAEEGDPRMCGPVPVRWRTRHA